MPRKLPILIIFCIPFLFLACRTVQSPPPIIQSYRPVSEHVLYGYPSTDCQILKRAGYVLCHDGQTKNAVWASYRLRAEYLSGQFSRTEDFRADPDVKAGQRSELSDYRGSGYDRGHLVPAGDMTRAQRVMRESFLLSNMSPQTPAFNRGIWKVLEDRVRGLARRHKDIVVVTGALFLEDTKVIGSNQVGVPSHFYKVIAALRDETPREAVAFVIPNAGFPADELDGFMVTIDELEDLSGLDFFHELDDALERALESRNRLGI